MLQRISPWWWLVGGALGLRLLSMFTLPLTDTTEARYGAIARLMAASGDWITPWFEPGVPFWGKPPLAFWSQALAVRLFGVTEFAVRLPALLATVASLALIVALARAYFSARAARLAAVIYSTCALVYVAAGAVLTDPFLTFGTTWAMVAFALAPRQPRAIWRYGFFGGLAIGMLAKGPLVLVLTTGALLPWLLWCRSGREHLRALPWGRGALLLAALVLPWYIAAELKTPGFLNYFIIGEHFLRFLDSGWAGDLYGSAHDRPRGSIWLDWLMASFPWGLIGIVAVATVCRSAVGRQRLRTALSDPRSSYLLAWSLFTPIFFTLAGNILSTYVLPALPAFAVLLGGHLDGRWPRAQAGRGWTAAALLVPLAVLILTLVLALQPQRLKTEKALVAYAQRVAAPAEPLLFLGRPPFSARFYSRERAQSVSLGQLPARLADASAPLHVAVPKEQLPAVEARLAQALSPRFQSRRYVLLTLRPGDPRPAADRPMNPVAVKAPDDE